MFEPLIYRLAIPIYYRRVRWFLRQARQGAAVQQQVLLAKLRRHAESDFGRAHGFSDIRSVADFRRRLPITNYEYYTDYIERVKQGEITAMFAPDTKLLMFALTSGTTNRSKFIPVTGEFFAEYRRSWQIWGAANYAGHTDQVFKKTLQLTSNWQQSYTVGGIPCGNISGLAAEAAPKFLHRLFVVPPPVIRIDAPAAKHYTALRVAMESPSVGMLITANPSTLLEFARRANIQRESLMRDIFDGTLSSDLDVPPEVRQALQPRVSRPNRARVRELQAIVKRTGTLYPKDFWPQVSVLAVWMGGSVGVYLPQLEEYYGRPALRDHGLSASEGRMTIPLEDGTSTGVLDYLHHYYEFVPEDEIEASQPTVLAAHELEEGRNYFILLTTSGGLYRYDIHDVVRCVGYEGQVPKLQFLNKGAHFSSLTGEKLSEFQVVSAVRAAFRELGLPLETFTLAPVMSGGRPGYVLLLEPSRQERDNARLARCVEQQLQGENCEYGEKLESGRLNALVVREVPRGAWTRFQQQRVAQRGNLEEFKHPCLVRDLQFAERLSAPPPDVLPPGTGPT